MKTQVYAFKICFQKYILISENACYIVFNTPHVLANPIYLFLHMTHGICLKNYEYVSFPSKSL